VLVCVIGGKLSEGINFSDNLARTVIVLGLPYPSTQSLSIKAKMAFYDKHGPPEFKGKDYYDNLCMRTLNQAIGRALRHKMDYACIVLIDERYVNQKAIQIKLPLWLQ